MPARFLLAALALGLAAPALAQPVTPGRPYAERVQTRTLDLILPDSLDGQAFGFAPFAPIVTAYSDAGYVLVAYQDGGGTRRDAVWFEGTYFSLPSPSGRVRELVDVNASGVVLGNDCAADQFGNPGRDCEPFVWSASAGLQTLGRPGGQWCYMEYSKATDDFEQVCLPIVGARAVAINASGAVAANAEAQDFGYEAVSVYRSGGWQTVQGGYETDTGKRNSFYAAAINDAGVVAGGVQLSHAEGRAATWGPGQSTPTEHTLPGSIIPFAGRPYPTGIAADGSLVGGFISWLNGLEQGAFVWPGGATSGTRLPDSDDGARVYSVTPLGDAYGFNGGQRAVWRGLGAPAPVALPACPGYAQNGFVVGERTFAVPARTGPAGGERRRILIVQPDAAGLPECPPQSLSASPGLSRTAVAGDSTFTVVLRLRNTGEAPLWNVRATEVSFLPAGDTDPAAEAPVLTDALPQPLAWMEIAARDSLSFEARAQSDGTFDVFARILADGPAGPVEALLQCEAFPGGEGASARREVTCDPTIIVGNVLTVTDDGDDSDADLADDLCDIDAVTPGQQCTLRAALETANATPGRDRIEFQIDGAGPFTISPTEALPDADEAVSIDATTQDGYAGAPRVALDGGGTLTNGLVLKGGDSIVRGLRIVGFTDAGVHIETLGGNAVEACFLGVTADGSALDRPAKYGVLVDDVPDNTVGGDTAADRNLIGVAPTPDPDNTPIGEWTAGVHVEGLAATGNTVAGNHIGVSAAGTAALGDQTGSGVILVGGSGTTIGGSTDTPGTAPGNVIGGLDYGILLTSTSATQAPNDVRIVGNLVGTNATGTAALPNDVGIGLVGTMQGVEIGGVEGEGNVVSGNVVSGNVSFGILLSNGSGVGDDGQAAVSGTPAFTRIVGNTVGLTADGLAPLGNGLAGIALGGVSDAEGTLTGAPLGTRIGEPGFPRNLIAASPIQIFVYGGEHEFYADPDADPDLIAATYTFIRNNYIGLMANGQVAGSGPLAGDLPANVVGVLVIEQARAYVGFPGGRNVIGGQETGVTFSLESDAVFPNILASNYVGTDPSGLEARPNGIGVVVESGIAFLGTEPPEGADYTFPFPTTYGNLISGNRDAGVLAYPRESGGETPPPNPQERASARTPAGYAATLARRIARRPAAGLARATTRRTEAQDAGRGGASAPDIVGLFFNRVGLAADGSALPNGAGYVPDTESVVQSGAGVLLVDYNAVVVYNVLSGNVGDGLAVYSNEITPDVGMVGTIIGAGFNEALTPLPNTRDGVYTFGSPRVRIGSLPVGVAFPEFNAGLASRIWYNGRAGVGTDGSGAGLLLTQGSFQGNDGLGIDLGSDGVGAPAGALQAPTAVNATLGTDDATGDPVLTLPVTAPAVTTPDDSPTLRLQAYAATSCDPSGFGEGLAPIVGVAVTPGASAPLTIPSADFDAEARALIARGVYVTFTATQTRTVGVGPATTQLFHTSEFSECVRVVAPEDVAEGPTGDGAPPLVGPGLTATSGGGSLARSASASLMKSASARTEARGTEARGTEARGGGATLYVARHRLAPDGNVFGGQALSASGTAVVADTVAARYWTLATDGTATVSVCLDAEGFDVPAPGFVVLTRARLGLPWTPRDARLDEATGRVCADAVPASGDVALGAQRSLRFGVAVAQGNAGWRLLSSPLAGLTVDGLAARNLVQGVSGYYPGAAPNLYTAFDGTVYARPTGGTEALAPGAGFFWYLYDLDLDPGGASVSRALPMTLALGAEASAVPAEAVLPLRAAGGADQGWNLVGNPFPMRLDVSDLGAWAEGGALASVIGQTWDPNAGSAGSYVPTTLLADEIPAWTGMFIENADAAQLRVPAPVAASRAATEAPRLVALELSGATPDGAALVDRAAIVVFHDGAGEAWDAWDAGKLAPLGAAHVAASFEGERRGEAVAQAQVSAARDPEAPVELSLAVEATGAAPALVLSWPRLDVPDDWRVTLRDAETGAVVDLRAHTSYAFEVEARAARAGAGPALPGAAAARTSGPARFGLRIEPRGATATEAPAPAAFALTGAAPNPVRASATVRFETPEAAAVRVAVFDVLGREVAVLADGERPAGRHALRLDAARLSAGVYVVRMTAGAFTATQTLTVVR